MNILSNAERFIFHEVALLDFGEKFAESHKTNSPPYCWRSKCAACFGGIWTLYSRRLNILVGGSGHFISSRGTGKTSPAHYWLGMLVVVRNTTTWRRYCKPRVSWMLKVSGPKLSKRSTDNPSSKDIKAPSFYRLDDEALRKQGGLHFFKPLS